MDQLPKDAESLHELVEALRHTVTGLRGLDAGDEDFLRTTQENEKAEFLEKQAADLQAFERTQETETRDFQMKARLH